MKTLKSVLITALGCLMLMCALGALLQGLPVPTVFFLIGGWVCIPPLRGILERRFRLRFQRWHKYVMVIGSWCVAGATLPSEVSQLEPSEINSPNPPSPQSLVGSLSHGLDSVKQDSQSIPSKATTNGTAKRSNNKPKPIKRSPSVSSTPTKSVTKPKPIVAPSGNRGGCYYHGRELHVGPRGGCYYWAGNSKEYVDRSYCSGCR